MPRPSARLIHIERLDGQREQLGGMQGPAAGVFSSYVSPARQQVFPLLPTFPLILTPTHLLQQDATMDSSMPFELAAELRGHDGSVRTMCVLGGEEGGHQQLISGGDDGTIKR